MTGLTFYNPVRRVGDHSPGVIRSPAQRRTAKSGLPPVRVSRYQARSRLRIERLQRHSNGTTHGFTLIAGNFCAVDFPVTFGTFAFRANEAGQIVGMHFHFGQHDFLATPSLIQKP